MFVTNKKQKNKKQSNKKFKKTVNLSLSIQYTQNWVNVGFMELIKCGNAHFSGASCTGCASVLLPGYVAPCSARVSPRCAPRRGVERREARSSHSDELIPNVNIIYLFIYFFLQRIFLFNAHEHRYLHKHKKRVQFVSSA